MTSCYQTSLAHSNRGTKRVLSDDAHYDESNGSDEGHCLYAPSTALIASSAPLTRPDSPARRVLFGVVYSSRLRKGTSDKVNSPTTVNESTTAPAAEGAAAGIKDADYATASGGAHAGTDKSQRSPQAGKDLPRCILKVLQPVPMGG